MNSSLPRDPAPDKDPRELADGILDYLTSAAAEDADLRLVLQQRAACGDALALGVEERLADRRRQCPPWNNLPMRRILQAGALRGDPLSLRTLDALRRRWREEVTP